jgi:hypothetical protein
MLQDLWPGPEPPQMSQTIAVVTPAYKAETLLLEAVRSVLAQTHPDWEHWIISDDLVDYEKLLADAGLADPRQRFRSTGKLGGGSTTARNQLFDEISTPYAAILDADDRLKPRKLELVLAALAHHPIVSVALDVVDDRYRHLRYVGDGPDKALRSRDYKFTSLSMDSMIVWDRRRCDARYDLTLTNMTDLELLMRLWRREVGCWHLGDPAHDYVKLGKSMSNGPGVTEKMIASKTELLRRLEAGEYPMADPDGPAGIAAFLRVSLAAERAYPAALATNPAALFEDTIEPLLLAAQAGSAASTSAA